MGKTIKRKEKKMQLFEVPTPSRTRVNPLLGLLNISCSYSKLDECSYSECLLGKAVAIPGLATV